jgi:hypothetical protein
VGAISALAPVNAVQAREVTEVLNARSYAELLQPIPNAVALLMAADAVKVARAKAEAEQNPNVKLAQYGYHHHHHHQSLVSSSPPPPSPSPGRVLTIFILIGGRLSCGTERGPSTQR